jgi:hypothetical protein
MEGSTYSKENAGPFGEIAFAIAKDDDGDERDDAHGEELQADCGAGVFQKISGLRVRLSHLFMGLYLIGLDVGGYRGTLAHTSFGSILTTVAFLSGESI